MTQYFVGILNVKNKISFFFSQLIPICSLGNHNLDSILRMKILYVNEKYTQEHQKVQQCSLVQVNHIFSSSRLFVQIYWLKRIFSTGFDEMILEYMTNLENICLIFLRLKRCSWRPTSILVFLIEVVSVYTSSNLAVLQLSCQQIGKTFSTKKCIRLEGD